MSRREDSERFARQQTEKSQLASNAVSVGALLGVGAAGAVGLKYRKQIGAGINKGLKPAYNQASRKLVQARNYVSSSKQLEKGYERTKDFMGAFARANKGSYLPVAFQGKKFDQRFQREVQKNARIRAQKEKQGFQGRNLEAVDALGELKVAMGKTETLTFQAMRHERLNGRLKKEFGDDFGSKLQAEVNEHLKDSVTFLDKQHKTEVNGFINKVLNNAKERGNIEAGSKEEKQFKQKMKGILSDYKDKDSKGFKKEDNFEKALEEQVQLNKKRMVDSYVKKYGQKDKEWQKTEEGGYKQIVRRPDKVGTRKERRMLDQHGLYNPTIDELLEAGHLDNYRKVGEAVQTERASKRLKQEDYNAYAEYKKKQTLNQNDDISSFWKEIEKINGDVINVKADKSLWQSVDTGEFVDMRWGRDAKREFADSFRRNTQVPLLNFNPLDLLHYTTWEGIRDAPKFGVRRIGQLDPILQNRTKTTEVLDKNNPQTIAKRMDSHYMILPDGKAMDFATGNIVAEGIYQVSAKYGPMQRQMAGMANITGKGEDARNAFLTTFDLGRQESPSALSVGLSAFTKFNNPHWGRNLVDATRKGVLDPTTGFKEIYDEFNREAKPLSSDLMQILAPHMNKSYGAIGVDVNKLDTREDIMDALGVIVKNINDPSGDVYSNVSNVTKRTSGISRQLTETWQNYERQGGEFFNGGRIYSPKTAVKPEVLSALDMQGTKMVSPEEDVKRLIHMHAIEQMELKSSQAEMKSVNKEINEALDMGMISKQEVSDYKNLDVLSKLRDNWWDDVYRGREETVASTFGEVLNKPNNPITQQIEEGLFNFNKVTHAGPQDAPYDYFGSAEYLSMNKARGYEHMISSINESIQNGESGSMGMLRGAWDIASQGFAGRRNMDQVTTLTSVPYVLTERLDNALGQLGLGLSQDKRGSASQILMNQFGRRVALPFMAFQQLNWADDMSGDFFSDTAAETYAGMTLGAAGVRDMLGLTNVFKEFSEIFGGSEQITDSPLGKAFNVATLGFFGSKSMEETEEWYESGETEVRKGRYWGIGSNTPFTGGKIDRFEANWYRKMKSDYKETDTMYGSTFEKWNNSWIPTLSNPWAPINHFLLDPYHYERKHREDRPYPVTGGFSELEQLPVIGTAINNTVGRILKPRVEDRRLGKAHEEYLAEINQNIKDQANSTSEGGLISGSPLGQLKLSQSSKLVEDLMSDIDPDYLRRLGLEQPVANQKEIFGGLLTVTGNSLGGEGGQRMIYDSDGVMAGATIIDPSTLTPEGYMTSEIKGMTGDGYSTSGGVQGMPVYSGDDAYLENGSSVNLSSTQYSVSDMSRQNLTDINTYMSEQAYGPSLGATGKDMRGPVSLDDLRDPNTVENLNDVASLREFNGGVRDMFYSASEVAGIYGFSVKTLMGFEESGRGNTLEESSRMTSYTRSFWDAELGGLGGQLSEIGRRYIPRDPNKHYYNPIRNTMPDWMPGSEYFTDFKHGDPYVKVAKGEIRLPGKAYESVNKLHSDALGEYGAVDRYKILADVAPYSEQYRFYKSLVSKMGEEGMLTDEVKQEVATVRDQTSKRKIKNRYYDKRFTNADVDYETVTVTDVIDANTFLTEEHPNNPIKLAGVQVKSDDEEARLLIDQFIKPGEQLKIAVDADPLFRVRDDAMQTIRAVVYTPHNTDDVTFEYSNKGQNLNYMLANRNYGNIFGFGGNGNNTVRRDDGSAVATAALFGQSEITMGKMWEKVTHDILPELPIVGVFADKFLQIRSPLEQYERTEVYGKAWRPWQEPIKGWIEPMVDTIASRNPVIAAAEGAGIGWLATRAGAKPFGAKIGATMGGLAAAFRVFGETGTDEIKIPERREKERDINEYFDRITYVKYKGLYEKAREAAMDEEGIDVEQIYSDNERRKNENKKSKKQIEKEKKLLSIKEKLGYGTSKDKEDKETLSARLKIINQDRPSDELGPYALLAMQYRDAYESTLYGADPNGDFQKIVSALPNKDRQYFSEFMKASPKERQRILELVPNDQRRFYQAKWGMETDEPETNESYFAKRGLPDANWEGWSASSSLDGYKIKVIKNEGLEATEFNMWQDSEQKAAQADAKELHYQERNAPSLGGMINASRLRSILKGAGLEDVQIDINTSSHDKNHISLNMNLVKDARDTIRDSINSMFESKLSKPMSEYNDM